MTKRKMLKMRWIYSKLLKNSTVYLKAAKFENFLF